MDLTTFHGMQRSPQGLSDLQSWEEKLLGGRTTILKLVLFESVDGPRLSDHVMMVNNAKALTEIFIRSCYSGNPRPDLAVPVLLTQLLHLQKLDITVGISPYLMAIVTRIVSGMSHIHQTISLFLLSAASSTRRATIIYDVGGRSIERRN